MSLENVTASSQGAQVGDEGAEGFAANPCPSKMARNSSIFELPVVCIGIDAQCSSWCAET